MEHALLTQLLVVSVVALLATVGVYGLVALLVRMDDAGLALITRAGTTPTLFTRAVAAMGRVLIAALPHTIRALGVIGTIAMLLVGGGMYVHNIDAVHHLLAPLPMVIAEFFAGLVVGGTLIAAIQLANTLRTKTTGP